PCSHQLTQEAELLLGPYVHSLICLLGFLGNSLVIATYAFYKRTKSMTDVFLLNVAVADLLFVLALPLLVYNQLSSWSMGTAACKLLRGSYSVNLYSGTLLLACISADRYVAIVQVRRSFRLRSLSHSRLICVLVWTAALLLSVPTFYFYHRYQPSHSQDEFLDGDNTSQSYVCEFQFLDNSTAWRTKVAVPSTQLAVGFVLPLLVMASCYSAVLLTLLRARNFQRHGCHLPYNLALLYETTTMFQLQSCERSDTLQLAKALTQTLAYLHCCLNPLLYAFIGVKFRNHFRRVLWDLWCRRRGSAPPRPFSRATSEVYVSGRRSQDGSSDNGSSFTM
uniref:Chemokine (C-C motif) receptor 6a n=1 Tax=Tetraodon nigroviridis TaxID=99883 RepID=H3CGS2_TETNG